MSTISYKSFNVENLMLTTPEENKQNPDMTKYQLLSFPRYLKDGKEVIPQIQGPWMTLNNYGIPGKLDKNGKPILNQGGQPLSDRELGKLRIPFDLNDPEAKKLYEVLTAIDQKCEDDKEKIWGDKKKANAYKYQSIVRQPAENPDAPEDAPQKPDYVTTKFDLDYKSGKVQTKVYINADGDRSEVDAPTLDEVRKYVRYKCEYRPVFSICKLYGGKAAGDDGKRKYGLGLKLKHIEVKPSEVTAQDEQEGFVDDDDDDVARHVLVKETKKDVPKVAAKAVKKEESEAEQSEDDKPAQQEKPAPKVAAKAPSKKQESEDEQSEDEKPAPKARRGRTAPKTTM